MKEHQDNFLKWFKEPLTALYGNEHAGFVILMISIPLLERYLREKSGVHEGELNSQFYGAFLGVFPTAQNHEVAKKFWQVYRNGLLHQVTLSRQDRKGRIMPNAGVHESAPELEYRNADDEFTVSPRKFSETVLKAIEADFLVFLGSGSPNHPPAEVSQATGISGYPGLKRYESS